MNRLRKNVLGGVGLEWDDLHFLEDGIREGIAELTKGFASNGFIIYGCEPIMNGLSITGYNAGAVVVDGEVCIVPGGNVNGVLSPGESLFWQVDVAYDASGLEHLDNGLTDDTYEVRTAKVVKGFAPVGALAYPSTTMDEILYGTKEVSNNLPTNFTTDTGDPWTIANGQHKITWSKKGKDVFVDCWINSSTMINNVTELRIKIPVSIGLPDGPFQSMGWMLYNPCMVGTDLGLTYIRLTIPAAVAQPIPNNPSVHFQFHFIVQ